ncbi:zinc-binding dehydrogenase [Noviherbaspirillum galbum]|uniref:Zinc-binding dehydrogenase n=1 Tax=Noviherbaspirillum galbum TaxID=2709383 RepID=A0A6B3STN7_9BURK|nr:zinc-binding dehydrogenase [Noviherbaspirillum galbum]NEX63971.1 zinc-binding dehydrogenase [Noviherbaspirillum galbum]
MSMQLRSVVKDNGELELSLASVPVPVPADNEVLVRVEATPINPSDIGLLFGAADMSTATHADTPGGPVITARVPEKAMKGMMARVNMPMPVGNEGAGTVVGAGRSEAAQRLLGKTVAVLGGAMYAHYRCVPVEQCLELPAGASPAEGASSFVNPLTALGMVETMRREGHKALVHTAAASNLGQMLNRICLAEGIGLVNVVRSEEQVRLLKEIGATHVCNSASENFMQELTDAIAATGATIGFDAIGGGRLAGQILSAMEAAIGRSAKEYSRYGSTTLKQVYIYGGLDMRPTEIIRDFGMTWSMGGWLLFPFLQKVGPERVAQLKQRVANELKTTFASHYTNVISLQEALRPDVIAAYLKRSTGEKFLINPWKDAPPVN